MRFNAYYGRPSNVNKTPFKEYYSSYVHVKYFIRPTRSSVCACHHKTIANARGNIKLRRYIILHIYNSINNNDTTYIVLYYYVQFFHSKSLVTAQSGRYNNITPISVSRTKKNYNDIRLLHNIISR